MEKKYISFDIEASGPTPGKYSMLSLGACMVGERKITFYREIKPINFNFVLDAMRVSSLGLKCLDDIKHIPSYNPESRQFDPIKVLKVLQEKGEDPKRVMADYAEWVVQNTKGFKPIEAAAPIKFDGMFTAYYFDNFYTRENPFGHSGEDINSVYRGVVRNINAHTSDLRIRQEGLAHNALDDALIQGKEFEEVLKLLNKK